MQSPKRISLTHEEFRKVRTRLGMTVSEFMREVGYDSRNPTVKRRFIGYETGKIPVPYSLAKLAWMIDNYGLPEWPDALVATFSEERHR